MSRIAFFDEDLPPPPEGVDPEDWSYITGADTDHTYNNQTDLWHQYGAQATEDWARKHPGTRQEAWWEFESKENRKQIGGTGYSLDPLLAKTTLKFKNNIKPRPSHTMGIPNRHWEVDKSDPPRYETERAYLQRLNLLFDFEQGD